jgi:hypothetical protein
MIVLPGDDEDGVEDRSGVERREVVREGEPFFFPFFILGEVGINPHILLISGVRNDCEDEGEEIVTADWGRLVKTGGGSNGGGDGI